MSNTEVEWDNNELLSTESISDTVIREKRLCERKGKGWIVYTTLKKVHNTWCSYGFIAYSRRTSHI